eukprot:TCONS_00036197-protein
MHTSTATRPQTSTATRPQTPIETKPPTLTETRPSASTGSGSLRTPPAAIVPKTLTFEKPNSYDIKDIPVAEVQEKLVGIKNCQTKEELDDCFASFDERFEAGYNKMVLNMDEREHFCRLISRFFIVERNHAEISQLLKGVHPDLLSLMRRFPEEGIKE